MPVARRALGSPNHKVDGEPPTYGALDPFRQRLRSLARRRSRWGQSQSYRTGGIVLVTGT
jgi:hypothetical protein